MQVKSKIYINIGSAGTLGNKLYSKTLYNGVGGYNGGGDGGKAIEITGGPYYKDAGQYWQSGAAGGGATHIATYSGLLSALENQKLSILIVSGGGGGAGAPSAHNGIILSGTGGDAGGITGNNDGTNQSKGASQTSGYKFGQGQKGRNSSIATYCNAEGNGGSGGGFYGGFAIETTVENSDAGGSGGSGFIGNTSLTNKHMACYNCETSDEESTKTISVTCADETPTTDCAKIGNGYARITYLGEN